MASNDKIGLPKLKGSQNYIPWSIRARATLIKEDLISAIKEDTSLVDEKVNEKALAWIQLLCEDGPILYIKDISSAKEAWDKLQDLYNPKGFTTEFLVLREFFNSSLEDHNSMEEYLNHIKNLVDDLKGKDIILPNQVVIAWVLNSLSSEYNGFISNITQALRNDPKSYTIETLFSSLLDEARGKESNSNSNKLLAITNKGKGKSYKNLPKKGKYCGYCKLTSHSTDNCYFLFPNKAPKTWKVNKKGNNKGQDNQNHQKKQAQKKEALIAALSKLDTDSDITDHGSHDQSPKEVNTISNNSVNPLDTIYTNDIDIPDAELFGLNEDEVCLSLYNPSYNHDMADANNIPDCLVTSDLVDLTYSKLEYTMSPCIKFIIDSAATINTVSNKNYFYSYKEVNKTVSWGKATHLKVKGQGNILIKYQDTGKIYLIKDVFYIPELGINLISVYKMPDMTVIFQKDKVLIYKKNNPITTGYKSNGLYYISVNILSPKNTICSSLTQENYHNRDSITDFRKWHIRLGHIGAIPLGILLSSMGISISKKDLEEFKENKCHTCLLAKDQRHINKESLNKRHYDILERIHSDIGGPLSPTYDHYKYYITFLDKKSRYLWVVLLKHKDEAIQAFETFMNKVENNKNGKRIREFFSDNGGEYINKHFKITFNKHGIIHNTTPAYTKEPNGLIERINLTLMNKVRAFLIASNAPRYL